MRYRKMKNLVISLLALASSTISSPALAENIYLLIKSEASGKNAISVSLHSLPMESMEQCEEAGAVIIAGERLDTRSAKRDGFECIVVK